MNRERRKEAAISGESRANGWKWRSVSNGAYVEQCGNGKGYAVNLFAPLDAQGNRASLAAGHAYGFFIRWIGGRI
jgi:hypothetical protein